MRASSKPPGPKTPLTGHRILVTRPQEQAGGFEQALARMGAEVVVFPTVEISPLSDTTELDQAIHNVGSYDWIVFTSANGVRHFLARCQTLGQDLSRFAGCVAAIGPQTARALELGGVKVSLVPSEYRAEGILDALGGQRVDGRRFLLARVAGARDVLPNTLRQRGAVVDVVETYRARAVVDGGKRLTELLRSGTVDCVTFTSSSTVNAFADMLPGAELRSILAGITVACIGPITAETARKRGLPVEVEAREYTVDGLIRALAAYYAVTGPGA